MKRLALLLPLFALAAAPARAEDPAANAAPPSFGAVVKIEVRSAAPDFVQPWKTKSTRTSSGTGVVIGPGRILTCAHVVADATFLRVRRHDTDAFFHGEIEFVDDDCDLALVRVADAAFMEGIEPAALGETPAEQSEVLAVGYPMGGDGISYTRGIVSRVEDHRYSHGWTTLLAVQVDAAINPGNSGGPVFDMRTWRVAGVAFQGNKEGESLNYIVPAEIVRHFLDDVADGRRDGFWQENFSWLPMESEAERRFWRMGEGRTGVRIVEAGDYDGEGPFRTNDVLLAVDGLPVSNKGQVRLPGNEPRSLAYPFYMHQVGDEVPVLLLRDGEEVRETARVFRSLPRHRRYVYNDAADWLVFGGMVFTTVSWNWQSESKLRYWNDRVALNRTRPAPDEEIVAVSTVLPDLAMEGYFDWERKFVHTADGVEVRNLRHLAEILDAAPGPFVELGLMGTKDFDERIVLDVAEMRAATPRVLERYRISSDRSLRPAPGGAAATPGRSRRGGPPPPTTNH